MMKFMSRDKLDPSSFFTLLLFELPLYSCPLNSVFFLETLKKVFSLTNSQNMLQERSSNDSEEDSSDGAETIDRPQPSG
jgi:hypothetical protein